MRHMLRIFLLNFTERVELHFAVLIHKDIGDPRVTVTR
jgi:hypothetical protein